MSYDTFSQSFGQLQNQCNPKKNKSKIVIIVWYIKCGGTCKSFNQ